MCKGQWGIYRCPRGCRIPRAPVPRPPTVYSFCCHAGGNLSCHPRRPKVSSSRHWVLSALCGPALPVLPLSGCCSVDARCGSISEASSGIGNTEKKMVCFKTRSVSLPTGVLIIDSLAQTGTGKLQGKGALFGSRFPPADILSSRIRTRTRNIRKAAARR